MMNDNDPILFASISGDVLTISIHHTTINAENALRMQVEFRTLLQTLPPNIKTIHLEISELLAMSSRGFESFLLLHQGCVDKKVALTVSKLTQIFHRLLSRMGFLRLLKIEDE